MRVTLTLGHVSEDTLKAMIRHLLDNNDCSIINVKYTQIPNDSALLGLYSLKQLCFNVWSSMRIERENIIKILNTDSHSANRTHVLPPTASLPMPLANYMPLKIYAAKSSSSAVA